MKKLLLVLPMIALLAAACNNSAHVNVPNPPATQNQEQVNLTPTNDKSTYCTGSTPREIGDVVYPVDPKYGKLNWLGQIFTANDCGKNRLKEITENREDYDLGSSLTLKTNPTAKLVSILQSVGYTCTNGGATATCKQWQLTKTVKLHDILLLQPYSEMFLRDDCINCG